MRITLVLLIFSFFLGCITPERRAGVFGYFEVDSLVAQQVQELVISGKNLEKTVWLDGVEEKNFLEPDSAGWMNELRTLSNLSLKKYAGSYEVERSGGSESYRLKEGEDSPVQALEIRYGSSGEIQEIIGLFFEDKRIYEHERTIHAEFEDNLLSSFRITGYQKMILKDTIQFKAEAVVQ